MSSGGSRTTLFINYRRDDTAPYAGRLYDRLTAHFGRERVFMDIDHIEPGEDFVDAINRKVGACDIAIVSIGPDWLSVQDQSGKRRLDDTEDFVRMEIVAALERKIRIIPVLVGGATMPRKQDLPEALAALSRRNAIELSESRFHSDVDRLIEAIEKPRSLAEKSAEPARSAVLPEARDSRRLSEPAGPAKSTRVLAGVFVAVAIVIVATCSVWFLRAREADPVRASAASSAPAVSAPEPADVAPQATPVAETKTEMEKARAEEWKTIQEVYVPENWLPEIRKNAEAGVADAQFELGIFYEFGLRSLGQDLPKAIEWYRKAAAQGNALAQEGVEDLSRTDAAASEVEEAKLDTRRQRRQQGILSHVLREMDKKAQ